jgi:hypothetical protein
MAMAMKNADYSAGAFVGNVLPSVFMTSHDVLLEKLANGVYEMRRWYSPRTGISIGLGPTIR